jgi:hypothetical protein
MRSFYDLCMYFLGLSLMEISERLSHVIKRNMFQSGTRFRNTIRRKYYCIEKKLQNILVNKNMKLLSMSVLNIFGFVGLLSRHVIKEFLEFAYQRRGKIRLLQRSYRRFNQNILQIFCFRRR